MESLKETPKGNSMETQSPPKCLLGQETLMAFAKVRQKEISKGPSKGNVMETRSPPKCLLGCKTLMAFAMVPVKQVLKMRVRKKVCLIGTGRLTQKE